MNIRDFTFDEYDRLLTAATENGYEVLTVAEYLATDREPDQFLLLRHDVDRRVDIARSMAELEASHGVASTYYFRTSTFGPDVVEELADYGHEIGYHYEDLVGAGGDVDEAFERFAANLERFRRHADVKTVCPHGSPLSSHNNIDMWEADRSLESFDLLGEAYLSIDTDDDDRALPSYFSDTGRHWGVTDPTFGTVERTDDLATLLESRQCPRAYVLAHPSRWARTGGEFLTRVAWDLSAETGKQAVKPVHRINRGANGIGGAVSRTITRSVMISRSMVQLVSGGR